MKLKANSFEVTVSEISMANIWN